MTANAHSLIAELDVAIGQASTSRQSQILQRVTDLLLSDTMLYSAEQIAIFDDVIQRLIEKAENPALVKLSTRLTPIDNAPPNTIATLAQNEDAAISIPVLAQSPVLSDAVIAKIIASTRGPKHLVAIAGRGRMSEAVTDALIDRGNPELLIKAALNPNARLSEIGFVKLINRAKTDKTLAGAIAARNDIPAELMPFVKLALG